MPAYKALYEQQLKENKELQEENKKYKKMFDTLPCDRRHEWWCEKNEMWRWEDDGFEEEIEDETDKYDGDDWAWVYGKNIIEQEEYKEVVLIMAGGGDHWENWTMTPNMNYIVNKDGKHPQHGKLLIQSSCGNYVSFQDKDYVPDDGECICEYEDCVEC
jgi:hypothetical protein